MVRIFGTSTLSGSDFHQLVFRSGLSDLLQVYRPTFRNEEALQRSFLGHRLVEFVLHYRYGLSGDRINIWPESKNQPYPRNIGHWHFNISHSGCRVVCAVGDAPVGIDIEKIKPGKFHVALRYFSDDEIRFLNQIDRSEADRWFFKIWTAKESYLKWLGTGLTRSMSTFSIIAEENVLKVIDPLMPNSRVFLSQFQLDDEYILSVCSPEAEIGASPEFIEATELFDYR